MGEALVPSDVPAVEVVVESVPEGKISDFLTGRHFKDTPEEYVRQNLAKALVRQYRYAPMDCAPEFPIRVGSARKRVDIAVFRSGTEHKQENIYIIVETKKADTSPNHRTEGIEQLKSYLAACVNAQYGLWTNGDERRCFAKREVDGSLAFEEIVEIPAAGQKEEDAQRPKRKDLRPATADNLLFAFRRCHNYIAANAGLHKTEAFWELLKLIFSKIEDERSGVVNFFVSPLELANATAAAPAKARIQKLFTERVVRKYPSIFASADHQSIDLSPSVVAYVVGQLQGYSLLASPVDVKGVAYEEVVGANLRGDRGEFFTPRNACRMAVAMLDPSPGDRLLDPAMGTGGFLITAMNHVIEKLAEGERSQWRDPANPTDAEREELWRKRHEYLSSYVFGLDLNPALVRAAKMNMVMNNDGSGGLFQANSLAHPHTWASDARSGIPLGSIDVLFTNPPFGANIVIDDTEVLRQYDLAAMWDEAEPAKWVLRLDKQGSPALQKSQPPEILFIERCIQFLRPGSGKMAMVIPNGILNNPALGYLRQWLLTQVQLLAVVDMHRDLFQPRNDTQTSMVLMRRLSPDETQAATAGSLDYPVFMAIAERIGHDKRGNSIYRHNERGEDVWVVRREVVPEFDESGNEVYREVEVKERVVDDELPEVAAAYRAWVQQQR